MCPFLVPAEIDGYYNCRDSNRYGNETPARIADFAGSCQGIHDWKSCSGYRRCIEEND